MMPMVFCASLPPCPSEYSAAEANCRIRNARSTANGVERTDAQDTIATNTSASRNPISGDSTIASNVFVNPPQSAAEIPALAMPPPTNPPISACELEDGIPNPQVIRFQTIAPVNAAKITCASMMLGSMIPVPMVCATFNPNTRKATKLKKAAHSTAYCGRSTRVDTMVAIELAASCSPLRKSNSKATAINPTRTGRPSAASTCWPCLYLFDHDAVDLVGHVVETVGDLFQMVVDFSPDDEIHRAGIAMLEKEFLQPDILEIVDTPLKLGQLFGNRRQHRDVAADRLKQRQCAADEVGATDEKRPHFAHRRLEGADLEQHDSLRRLLHLVDSIVHRRDQVLDVAAIERRDESTPHRREYFTRDIVGIVLELIDALAEDRRFLPALKHALQRERALLHGLGVFGEKFEKALLFGKEG